MSAFLRFPNTPHLEWLGPGQPRGDKVMPPADAGALLSGEIVVEEKMDGANVGISLDPGGRLQVQNRGQYLAAPFKGQFSRLSSWLAMHEDKLQATLGPDCILFGEWCAARHSMDYTALPDWFLAFDVYDRKQGRFWSAARRNDLAKALAIATVPPVLTGHTTLETLKDLVLHAPSRFHPGLMEGIVIRRESGPWLETRAKLVHPDFTQSITEHWARRGIEWNQLRSD